MSGVLHPKCGKRFPNTERTGHCATCCETFIGQGAFDAHLTRDANGKYVHSTADEKHQWWADERGYWHKGPRLTEEQKALRFPRKEPA